MIGKIEKIVASIFKYILLVGEKFPEGTGSDPQFENLLDEVEDPPEASVEEILDEI